MTARQTPKTATRATGPVKRKSRDKPATPVHPRSVSIEAQQPEGDPDQAFAEGLDDQLDADLRYRMVSETAYRLYAERGYADGYDMDDWLQAEAAVDHMVLNPETRRNKPTPE